MSRPSPDSVRQLLRLAGQAPGGHATDRDLVTRFAQDRDEGAFADLMARHGPMVLGVCRRVVRDAHAADDAFQATFLVLARKAGRVKWRESIGGWLFEVAHRVAKKVAAQSARRQSREGAGVVVEPAAPATPQPSDLTALQAALDDELRRLPEKLRVPIVLCHLEGLSQDEVAAHLGITDGQLRGRLYRAKEKLRGRLTRRGFSLTAVLLALTVSTRAQALPPVLAAGTLRVSVANSVPDAVKHVIQQVSSDMWYSSKALAAVVLVGVIGLGTGGFAVRQAVAEGERPRVSGPSAAQAPLPAAKPDDEKPKIDPKDKVEVVRAVVMGTNPGENKLVVKLDDDQGGNTEVVLGKGTPLTFAGKPVPMTEVRAGMRAELRYKGNSKELLEVRASWSRRSAVVKAVDVTKGAFSIETGGDDGGFEIVLSVAPGAGVFVDSLPAGIADIPPGRRVELELSLDKKSVERVEADGDKADIPATCVAYDAATQSLTVKFEAEAGSVSRVVTLALPVSATAKVRHDGKDAKLADLKPGMPLRLNMSADRKTIVGLLAADVPKAGKHADDD